MPGTSTSFSFSNRGLDISPDFEGVGAPSTSAQITSTMTTTLPAGSNAAHQEFQNFTATGPIPLATMVTAGNIGDFGAPRTDYRAWLNFKASTGFSTANVLFAFLETASSTGYAPTYTIAGGPVLGATSTDSSSSVFLFGQTPQNSGMQFARVNFFFFSTSAAGAASTNVDAVIEAA
jgi:hypothetical protein